MCLSEEMQFVGGTICTDTQGSFIKHKKNPFETCHKKEECVVPHKWVSCTISALFSNSIMYNAVWLQSNYSWELSYQVHIQHLTPAIEVIYYWDYRQCFLKYSIYLISIVDCSGTNYFIKVFCYKFYRYTLQSFYL